MKHSGGRSRSTASVGGARGRVSWPSVAFYGTASAIGLAVLLAAIFIRDPDTLFQVAGPATAVADVAAMAFAIVVSRRVDFDTRTRRAWRWLAASAFIRLLSGVAYGAFHSLDAFPAPGDVLRMLMVPAALIGVLTLPMRPRGRLEWRKLLLDVGAVVCGGAMVMWYLVVGPALTAKNLDADTVAASIAFPIGDIALMFGVLVAIRRGVDPVVRRPLYLLAGGLGAEIVGTSYLGYLRSHLRGEDQPTWLLACWLVGHFLFAAAAFEQCRKRGQATVSPPGLLVQPVSRLPYLGIGVGLALLVVAALREDNAYPWSGLAVGVAAITIIVTLRQNAALRENHDMAVTDNLTGLANRARLHNELGRALANGQRTGQTIGVLVADLNGFKRVNDTLGHAAGDGLLKEFAGMLNRVVLGSDVVGRLGGDEFAVILYNVGTADNAEAVMRRLHGEMEIPIMIGDVVVQVEAAVGYALSRPGESDVDDLLRRADADMYRIKRLGKGQAADLPVA
jgi:diguanylate cyclase (GGDEF)-like protein